MTPKKFITLFVVALGMMIPGACDKTGPSTSEEEAKERLKELLNAEDKLLQNQTIRSSHMGKTMKYTVWLPGGYDETKEYPFLYLLHGYGDDNNSWTTPGSPANKGNAAVIAKDYLAKKGVPMVIIMPDGLVSFYQGSWEQYFHEELIPEVEKTYHCNGKRAIAGLSMGGYGTLYNVLNHPGKFTYGYAMSPATDLEGFGKLVKAQKDPSVFPPITLESGTGDMTVSISSVRDFSSMLTENGVRHELIERDGGHTWPFWNACLEKALKKIGDSFGQ